MDLPRDDFDGHCRYEWRRSENSTSFDGIEITRDGSGCDKEAMVNFLNLVSGSFFAD